jgi:hypothetical protein
MREFKIPTLKMEAVVSSENIGKFHSLIPRKAIFIVKVEII